MTCPPLWIWYCDVEIKVSQPQKCRQQYPTFFVGIKTRFNSARFRVHRSVSWIPWSIQRKSGDLQT